MSGATSPVTATYARNGPYYLSAFEKPLAPLVARWVTDPRELFWLAPKTPPPLTAAKVIAWPDANASPRLLYRDGLVEPLGYGELNPMPGEKGHLWIGHCLIRPDRRGLGLGRLLVDLILAEAFPSQGADRVSLVVFPDNVAALGCYRSAGFRDVGEHAKYFHTTGCEHRMLRMSVDREQYELAHPQARLD